RLRSGQQAAPVRLLRNRDQRARGLGADRGAFNHAPGRARARPGHPGHSLLQPGEGEPRLGNGNGAHKMGRTASLLERVKTFEDLPVGDQIAYVRLGEAIQQTAFLEGLINEAWQWARLPEDVHRELMAVLHDTRSNLEGVFERF